MDQFWFDAYAADPELMNGVSLEAETFLKSRLEKALADEYVLGHCHGRGVDPIPGER